ncbi:MAG: hypothetical protein WCI78_11065, partial [Mycobacterium sp.]
QHLFGNDWVGLAAREHPDQAWQRWTRNGWRTWETAPANPANPAIPATPATHDDTANPEVMPCR